MLKYLFAKVPKRRFWETKDETHQRHAEQRVPVITTKKMPLQLVLMGDYRLFKKSGKVRYSVTLPFWIVPGKTKNQKKKLYNQYS